MIDADVLRRDAERLAEPLPARITAENLSRVRSDVRQYERHLQDILTFVVTSSRRGATERAVKRRLSQPPERAILEVRNKLLIRLSDLLELSASEAIVDGEPLSAARLLVEAIDCHDRLGLVPVVERGPGPLGSWHSVQSPFLVNSDEHRYHLQMKRLEAARSGLQTTIAEERVAFMEHALSASIWIAAAESGLSSTSRARRIAELLSKAFPQVDTRPWQGVVAELIKALVYGVAASGLWDLYKTFRGQNEGAMLRVAEQIQRHAFAHVAESVLSLSLQSADAIALRDVIFKAALDGYLVASLGESGAGLHPTHGA